MECTHPICSVTILYEDAERTMKLVEQMSSSPLMKNVRLGTIDAGVECGIITCLDKHSTSDGKTDKSKHYQDKKQSSSLNKDIVFSRCSGSYASRGHHQSPYVIESIISSAENCEQYRVFNGTKAFRLEMNKILAFFYIKSDTFKEKCLKHPKSTSTLALRVPLTVAVTKLTPKVVHRALMKNNFNPGDCFIKGVVGGGSTTVRRLDASSFDKTFLSPQLRSIRSELDPEDKDADIFIIQAATPSANYTNKGQNSQVQYRFELINKKVYYVVRIVQNNPITNESSDAHKVQNLCMCDLDIDDENVNLTLIKTVKDLSLEPGMKSLSSQRSPLDSAKALYSSLEMFAEDYDLHVVALEGTLYDGTFWTFDINTNTNYNDKLESQAGITPASWKVLETMIY